MYTQHTHCRACGYGAPGAQGIKSEPTAKLIEVFDLGIQPLANDFSPGEERSGYAPLKVLFCPRCSLAQLSVVVNPSILYRHYAYITSTSNMMRDHFEKLIADIGNETSGQSVLEIGSNDGRLLAAMQEKGYRVLGIDPAENLAELARSRSIPTQTGFFGKQTAIYIQQVDIVIARHVFCHVDDWRDFIAGLEEVSHSQTLVCIEAPYAADTLKNCEFDQVYHEHLSFLSIRAIEALLKDTQFRIHHIIRYPIHGGTILVMLRRKDSGIEPRPSIAELKENITLDDWQSFADEARSQIGRLRTTVQSLTAEGKRVAGLGASAKSTVWINACGFTRKDIAFIADNTPQKQYTYSPGTEIPIVDEGAILRELPDYVVMWAWNYRSEIMDKFSLARSKGVKFIIPVPQVEIV